MKVFIVARGNSFSQPSFMAGSKPAANPAPAAAPAPTAKRSAYNELRPSTRTTPSSTPKGQRPVITAEHAATLDAPSNVIISGERASNPLVVGSNVTIQQKDYMAAKGIQAGRNFEAKNLQSGGPAIISANATINRLFVEDQSGQASIVQGPSKVKEIEYYGGAICLGEPQSLRKLTIVGLNNQQPVLHLGGENVLGYSGFMGFKRRTKLFLNPKIDLTITLPPASLVKPENFLEHAKSMISFRDLATGRKLSGEVIEKAVKVVLRAAQAAT